MLLLGSGCATRAPLACPESKGASRAVKVYFATDRQRHPGDGALDFGREPTAPPALNMGWERVALGQGHRIGKVDRDVQITPVHDLEAQMRDTGSNGMRRTDAEIAAFVNGKLRAAIRALPQPGPGLPRQVLVFIHGYNNEFDYAVRKTAQLGGDIGLVDCAGKARGVVIAYSWPARGAVLSYLADEESVEWTQQRLVPFLRELARVCREERAGLNLVAHSMGARALVRSLSDIASRGDSGGKIADNVILLAPDIGKALFDQYVERLLPLIGHLTIYVSARDRALSFSTFLHGGHQRLGLLESTVAAALELARLPLGDHRELGSIAGTSVARGKIDMIDVTRSFAAEFGHSYEDPEFLGDLRELIFRNTPAGTGERSNLERNGFARGSTGNSFHEGVTFFRLRAR